VQHFGSTDSLQVGDLNETSAIYRIAERSSNLKSKRIIRSVQRLVFHSGYL
jgi:hypothetical protein